MSTRQESVDTKGKTTLHIAPAAPESPKPAAPSAAVQLVKKITLKTVCGAITKPDKPTALFRVFGIAHSVKPGTGTFGPFVAFVGSFEARNLLNGERFASGTCFLPRVVEDLLYSNMRDAQSKDANNSIQFAMEIGVKPHPTSPVGYEITAKPLVAIAENDALSGLRAQIGYEG